ncbi:CocE/NonD family hydrolase [Chitinophaga lutea]
MKTRLILLLALCCHLAAFAGTSEDSLWLRQHYEKKEVRIPMRDGARLFTAVYAPKDNSVKHPILISRTPYSCAPYGEDKFPALYNRYLMSYLRAGYILVFQDVRGRWMSEGEFVNVRPFNPNKKTPQDVDEASDTYDTIDWLVKNLPSNNGKAGVFGISYPGFYSTMAALSGHPALKAVSPQAPVTDWFIGDDFHHNGAFMLNDAFAFYASFGKPRPQPTTVPPTPFPYPVRDNYKFFLEAGSLTNIAHLMGDSIRFWKDLYAHPTYDAWWQVRNIRNFVQGIRPAVLVVGGTFDAEDCFGAWETYKTIEAKNPGIYNKLVMGPWYHGQWAANDGTYMGNVRFGSNTSEWYQQNIEIPFFEHYLNDKGNGPDMQEAAIFFTGENAWRQFPSWPAPGMQQKAMYLQKDGGLSFDRPSANGGYSGYTSDPAKPVPYTEDVHWTRTISYMTDDQRFASRRPDVLVFQTGPLHEDMTLGGPLQADLRVSITGTDADFIVKLIDVFPDDFSYGEAPAPTTHARYTSATYPMNGYQMLVRGEVMRGKFRNSFEKPAPFVPGQATAVKFTLPDVAHTFRKGHRIMVQVQSSWFPLVDRNPQQFMDIYRATDKDFRKAGIRIYHDAARPSQILLPVLPK